MFLFFCAKGTSVREKRESVGKKKKVAVKEGQGTNKLVSDETHPRMEGGEEGRTAKGISGENP